MRQIIISVIGLAILALGYFGMQNMAGTEKPVRPKEVRSTPIVFTQIVENGNTPVNITSSGNLIAKDRIDIYSEVQGIFEYSSKAFKPGSHFNKGSVLLKLNSDEHRATLRSQKSSLYNQLVAILPDLKFDYPEAFQKWKTYVNTFDFEGNIQDLPKTSSEKEKLFIAGKNIVASWHTVKNMEERLTKYTIYTPYSGVLTVANINKGALVRQGQKLGEYINPNIYELEVAVNSSYADVVKKGNSVKLHNIERNKSWSGKITRINSLIDPSTQTIQTYIQVSGQGLREGMYLEADLKAQDEENTFEISRKLIAENNTLFVLEGDVLKLREITPIHFTEKTAIIKGLEDGTEILEKVLPGAYDGIQVKRFEEQ